MIADVAVIIVNHENPDKVRSLISDLRKQSVVPKIFLLNGGSSFAFEGVERDIVSFSENVFWERWKLAEESGCEYVISIEDGVDIVSPSLVEETVRLLRCPENVFSIVGIEGTTASGGDTNKTQRISRVKEDTRVDVVCGKFMALRRKLLEGLKIPREFKSAYDVIVSAHVAKRCSLQHLIPASLSEMVSFQVEEREESLVRIAAYRTFSLPYSSSESNHVEIINSLIRSYGYSSYLEIGLESWDLYNKVIAASKRGVEHNSSGTCKISSDDFFKNNTLKYDLIFIDGVHTEEQARRDIDNALSCLKDGGTIVVHDCNPTEKEWQSDERPIVGWWAGKVWKVFARLVAEREDLQAYTVDCWTGCGIIQRGSSLKTVIPDEMDYEFFSKHRNQLLHLISIDDFRKRLPVSKKTVVYTAVIGGYDTLKEPLFPDDNCDYVCFTDAPIQYYGRRWDVVTVNRSTDDNSRDSRRLKILGHRWFGRYDKSVWIDACCRLKDLNGAVVDSLLGDSDAVFFSHPDRKCAFREAKACVDYGKFKDGDADSQLNRYREEGFPEGFGLSCGTFIIRRNTASAIEFSELWWKEFSGGCRRDQICLDYCRWKTGIKTNRIKENIRSSPLFDYYTNHPKWQIDVLLVRFCYSERAERMFNNTLKKLLENDKLIVSVWDNTGTNIGLVAARNELLKRTGCPVVCVMDYDVEEMYFNWWEMAGEATKDDVGIVIPCCTGENPVMKDVSFSTPAMLGCHCMISSRRVFDRFGGYDGRFFVYEADTDFNHTILMSGLKIVQHNGSSYRHAWLSGTYKKSGHFHKVDGDELEKKIGISVGDVWKKIGSLLEKQKERLGA